MVVLEEAASVSARQREHRASLLPELFSWRRTFVFGKMEAFCLTLFIAVASFALHFHEPWDDEAQAWLIARDNTVWQIVRYRLHYEGAPPLWHLLLHIFHALGGSYLGIGWLSICLASAGIYVWLRWAPFPAAVRLLFPFTFFIQYQYAVIARSYVLFPLFVFALCVLYQKKRAVVWFALLAGCLANISLQGFVVAAVLIGLYFWDTYRQRNKLQSGLDRSNSYSTRYSSRRQNLIAVALFGVMACGAIYCAIPAPDLDFAIGGQVSTGTVHRILDALVGETPRNAPMGPLEQPILGVKDDWVAPQMRTAPRAWLATLVYPRQPANDHHALRWLFQNAGPQVLDLMDAATWPITNSNLLAVAFLVAAAVWLRRQRRLRMLLPWVALLVTGQVLWTAEHHAGMLLIALVAGLWIAADAERAVMPSEAQNARQTSGTSPQRRSTGAVQQVLLGAFTVILLIQIAWTVVSVHADLRRSYDPGPETARWMIDNPMQRVAAFGFPTVSIQPWFPHSPFFNVPTSWWQWSSNIEIGGIHHKILDTHPDAVVYGLEFPGRGEIRDQWLPITHISEADERNLPRDPIVKDLREHGYRETHLFCGTRFARFSSAYRICDMVFEPTR